MANGRRYSRLSSHLQFGVNLPALLPPHNNTLIKCTNYPLSKHNQILPSTPISCRGLKLCQLLATLEHPHSYRRRKRVSESCVDNISVCKDAGDGRRGRRGGNEDEVELADIVGLDGAVEGSGDLEGLALSKDGRGDGRGSMSN